MNTESVQCRVFPTLKEAQAHGPGGISYRYRGQDDVEGPDIAPDQRRFPEDVSAVVIVMPVSWDESFRILKPDEEPCIHQPEHAHLVWRVAPHYEKGWQLSGTYEKPTLSPSLHWINVWHGFLTDGYLKSC